MTRPAVRLMNHSAAARPASLPRPAARRRLRALARGAQADRHGDAPHGPASRLPGRDHPSRHRAQPRHRARDHDPARQNLLAPRRHAHRARQRPHRRGAALARPCLRGQRPATLGRSRPHHRRRLLQGHLPPHALPRRHPVAGRRRRPRRSPSARSCAMSSSCPRPSLRWSCCRNSRSAAARSPSWSTSSAQPSALSPPKMCWSRSSASWKTNSTSPASTAGFNAEGVMALDGSTTLRDLGTQLGWTFPREAGVETLAGFLLAQLGHLPVPGRKRHLRWPPLHRRRDGRPPHRPRSRRNHRPDSEQNSRPPTQTQYLIRPQHVRHRIMA